MKIGLTKRSISAVAVAALTAAAVVLPSGSDVANAATSGYSDAEQLGRNMIGEESYPSLNPTATGGEITAKVGDSIEYKYTVNTGFPSDPDALVAQRWIKFNVCQDPKAPFTSDPTAAQLGLSGAPGFTINKTDANCWTVVAGSEYAQDGDYKPNKSWNPPATLSISIPATIDEKPADGSSLKGSVHFLSGRLAETDPDQTLTSTFVRNNQDGTCVAATESKLTLKSSEIGYWVVGATVYSDPRYQRYYYGVPKKAPQLVSGSVTVNTDISGYLEEQTWSAGLYDTDPQNEFEDDTAIGYVSFKDYDTPVYAATDPRLWVAGESGEAVATFQSTYPCERGVSTLEDSNTAGYFAFGVNVLFHMIRPPEDATASADFVINFDEPKFQVEKSAKQSSVAVDENNEFTADYIIKVTNVGDVAGTFDDLTDNLSDQLPAGFTGTVSPTTIKGEELKAGESKEYTVTLTGSVNPADASANDDAGWTAAGQCDTESGDDKTGDKTKGLYNQVIMGTDNSSDADEIGNNDACVTVEKPEPKFAVAKTTDDQAVTIADSNETIITRSYTVTVTNTGSVAGTSKAVTDTPAVPKGFAISKVVIDDNEVDGANGAYEVTSGDKLEPGKSKEHTVVVTYAVTPKSIDADGWKKLSECKADGDTPDSSMGIYNKVTMDGDSDGEDNNDACTPVNPTTTFAVKKELADTQAKTVTVADDNTFTVEYKITVTNTGSKAGTFPEVKDVPKLPTGFEVESIDPETIPGEELAAGESKTYTLTMKGKVNPQSADWDAASATCSNEGEGDSTKGLFNVVTMDADSDGPENNDACVNVEKPKPKFSVSKKTSDTDVELKSAEETELTRTYTVTTKNEGSVKGTSAEVLDTPNVPAGFAIKSVTVDGVEVSAVDGSYKVTAGDELEPGATKDHTVVVVFTVTPNKVTDWKSLGECSVDGDNADASKGVYNKVTMDGDSDGEGNNHVCTKVTGQPKFKVEKNLAAGQANPVVVGTDNGFTVNYVITVTNTGSVAGTFEDLTDNLSDELPAGFTGAMDKTTIKGEELQPGESKDYTVTLTGSVDPAKASANDNAGWKAAQVCDTSSGTDGAGDKTKGLYNQVIMGTDNSSDGDGIGNNDACVPIQSDDAAFKVEKNLAKKHLDDAGKPVAITIGEDNAFTVDYVITVTNTGKKAGTFEDLTDNLSDQLPAGFTGEVSPKTIAGELLQPGESKDYTVTLTGSVDTAKASANDNAGWKNAQVCDTESGDDKTGDKTKGLYNQVIMGTDNSSDGDGIGNNDACIPVEPPTPEDPPVIPPSPGTTTPATKTPTLPLVPVPSTGTAKQSTATQATATPTTSTTQSKGKGILANTGASVLGLAGIAMILSVAGCAVLIRKKKES